MTYNVITHDGDKYGPATVEELRKWLTEGRIGPATVVEDENGVRTPLSELPGFSGPTDAPPVQTMAPPQASRPYSAPTATSNRVLWVIPVAVGCVAIFGVAVVAAILFPVFSQAKYAAKRTETLRRAKNLGKGAIMYSQDYDDLLPPVLSSAYDAKPFIQRYIVQENSYDTLNPAAGEFLGNSKIAGKACASFADPAGIPLFFDSKPWPGTGSQRAVVWLDGHSNFEHDFDPAKAASNPGKK